jgi:SulP family sulfate permease
MRASATLTLLVGAILLLASLLRSGFIANFISEPVLIGFKAGVALVIVLDQVPKLLGVHLPKGTFVHNLLATLQAIPHASLPTLAVGIVMIVLLVGIGRFFPRALAPLIVVAIGIACVRLFGLEAHGVETVGQIPQGLPSFTFPDFSLVAQLWPGAVGIALMSFTETIAAGRAFATSDEPKLRPNQELAATGLANAAGAVALGDGVFGTCVCLVQDLGAAVTAGLVPLAGEEVSSASDIVGDRNVGNWTRSLEKTRSRIQSSATRTFFAKPGSLLR